MSHDFEGQLPEDLRPIVDGLREGRAVADGQLLERVETRVRTDSRRRWHRWVLVPRTAVALTLVLACVAGAQVTNLHVVMGIAALASSFTQSTSNNRLDSAAMAVYCTNNCVTPTSPTVSVPPTSSVKSVSTKKPKKTKKHKKKHKKKKHKKKKKKKKKKKAVSPAFTG